MTDEKSIASYTKQELVDQFIKLSKETVIVHNNGSTDLLINNKDSVMPGQKIPVTAENYTVSVTEAFNRLTASARQTGKSRTWAAVFKATIGTEVYTRTGSYKRASGKMRNRKRMFVKSLELNFVVHSNLVQSHITN